MIINASKNWVLRRSENDFNFHFTISKSCNLKIYLKLEFKKILFPGKIISSCWKQQFPERRGPSSLSHPQQIFRQLKYVGGKEIFKIGPYQIRGI